MVYNFLKVARSEPGFNSLGDTAKYPCLHSLRAYIAMTPEYENKFMPTYGFPLFLKEASAQDH
jgi:hypothetical protein